MAEHLLDVVTTDAHGIPARICGLLAQRNIEVSNLQMIRQVSETTWCVQLTVVLADGESPELVVKRLNRLVDVLKVVVVSGHSSHVRRSVFVRVRPAVRELGHVREIAHLFGAEVLDVSPIATMLHLSASPSRCEQFVGMLEPFGLLEVVRGAVSGVRRDPSPVPAPQIVSPVGRLDRTARCRLTV